MTTINGDQRDEEGHPLIAPLLIGAVAPTVRAEDTRIWVELPPPMQAHMLANMRDHLVALETITRQLA